MDVVSMAIDSDYALQDDRAMDFFLARLITVLGEGECRSALAQLRMVEDSELNTLSTDAGSGVPATVDPVRTLQSP